MPGEHFTIRRATTADVPRIQQLIEPLIQRRILLGKERVVFYELIQEFLVAEDANGELIGCGALHVMWADLAEVRTLAVLDQWRGRGVGHALVQRLIDRASALGVTRVFCLTFEIEFFERHGFRPISDVPVPPEVYAEMVRSVDEGVAEFLDLARVKQNTLGNTRMLLVLS
ncbi:MAG: amino-acid N-acetyltransferase [Microbacterium sp.]|nr:amino-acid N-acetyltransferase [Microbacterium sp.]